MYENILILKKKKKTQKNYHAMFSLTNRKEIVSLTDRKQEIFGRI